MPLPLPNLDTRRWRDLVDEGRALIPRYAPTWTDHNVHDPGIMLLELVAWLVESLMYRANRVTERERRKFLSLVGFAPRPPLPAVATLACTLAPGSGVVALPAGVVFLAADGAGGTLPFTTRAPATLVEASLVALQQFDGAAFADRTRALRDALPVPAFGTNPVVPAPYEAARAPALYLGFDAALPPGVAVTLHAALAGGVPGEREAILAEAADAAARCAPAPPELPCTPCLTSDRWCADEDAGDAGGSGGGATPVSLPPHHAVRLAWEWLAADGWHPLAAAAGEVADDTRALTLDGDVTLRVPGAMALAAVGAVATPRYWVRCRMLAGPYDAAPVLLALLMNAVSVEQSAEVTSTFVLAAGAPVTGTVTVGARQPLVLSFGAAGAITALAVAAAPTADGVEALVVAYAAPTATAAGQIVLTLESLGTGSGLPGHLATLRERQVARGEARLWSVQPPAALPWTLAADLDAAGPTDAAAVLDAARGTVTFGDGARGRVATAAATFLASYRSTAAARGTVASRRAWSLADSPVNTALLGTPAVVAASLAQIENPLAAWGGAEAESLEHAAGRAVGALWAHERLVQLSPTGASLDQLAPADVLDVDAPARATNLPDFERIARSVPGTRVRRARAWSRLDAGVPCADAAGTVTLVIVPELPLGAPTPSAGLLRAVRAHLEPRRVLGTRLLVVAPRYVVVGVTATVRLLAGADPARVGVSVRAALAAFLDPITGGPAGRGWPFGRDVFRSEVLALVDGVPGVDHVTALALAAEGCEPQCGNVCVPPTALVRSGTHAITVDA